MMQLIKWIGMAIGAAVALGVTMIAWTFVLQIVPFRETNNLILIYISLGYTISAVFAGAAMVWRRRGLKIGFWAGIIPAVISAGFGTLWLLLVSGFWWRFWLSIGPKSPDEPAARFFTWLFRMIGQ